MWTTNPVHHQMCTCAYNISPTSYNANDFVNWTQRPNAHKTRTELRMKTQADLIASEKKSNDEVVNIARLNLSTIEQQCRDQTIKVAESDENISKYKKLLQTAFEEKKNLTDEKMRLTTDIAQNLQESTPESIHPSMYNINPRSYHAHDFIGRATHPHTYSRVW